jgi:hypothetical protein
VPDYWFGIPETERESRGKIDSNVCIVDGHFFVRRCIEIPVIGQDRTFVWGAWVFLSRASFARVVELWDSPEADREPPRFGWLSNNIKVYPPTLNLRTHVHLRSRGVRPGIELEPTDHPLALEQRNVISLARVEEVAAALLHRH